MSDEQFESIPRVKRFAAVPRKAVNGEIVVQVIVELQMLSLQNHFRQIGMATKCHLMKPAKH